LDLDELPGEEEVRPELENPGFEGSYLEAVEALVAEIRARSTDNLDLVRLLIQHIDQAKNDDRVRLLLGKRPSSAIRADVISRILAHLGTPTRIVNGISLRESTANSEILRWIEVWDGESWRPYHLETGEQGIPEYYFPWWYGTSKLSTSDSGLIISANISSEVRQEDAIETALAGLEKSAPTLLEFSLFSLPIQTQMVYRVLLLIPIGAFLVVILRNVIGLKTFGTFMPVLVSLAFRETDLVMGILLFSLLLALGLAVRFYLEHLKLLLVPRLACVLIVVVLLMASLSVVAYHLGITVGLSVALFPMVIITMTIERMSIAWDELGPEAAIKQAVSTLLAAAATYGTIRITHVEHIVFVFPELLLVVLALTLLLGRYKGYRLFELFRFKALANAEAN
ncbi:MAG: UUP1 family membrane protein, partial [Bdellovibrionales bacterium]|nr:UUP1 family membrane protein [Bdellovibrionales bacterium]